MQKLRCIKTVLKPIKSNCTNLGASNGGWHTKISTKGAKMSLQNRFYVHQTATGAICAPALVACEIPLYEIMKPSIIGFVNDDFIQKDLMDKTLFPIHNVDRDLLFREYYDACKHYLELLKKRKNLLIAEANHTDHIIQKAENELAAEWASLVQEHKKMYAQPAKKDSGS